MTEREEQAIIVLNTLYNNPLLSDIHRQALEVGIMAIKAASSSENQNKWIPVSERLPEKPDYYPHCGIFRTYFLVSLASGCVKALGYEFDKDRWQITGSPVVAWMPLPESYKAEGSDKE